MSGKAQKEMPSAERLNELLRYEAKSGKLYWRVRPLDSFSQGKAFGRYWNARWADTEALACPSGGGGYLHGKIDSEFHLAHRVIWKMHHGTEPQEINWRDGDIHNNRLENLFENFDPEPSAATLHRRTFKTVGRRRAERSDKGRSRAHA